MPENFSGRATIEDKPDGLHITIPREFNPLGTLVLALGFVLIFWQGSWIVSDIRSPDRSYPDFISMVIWLAVLCLILRAVLWSIWGRERIVLHEKNLSIRREILSLGTTQKFELAQVEGLRFFASKGFRIPILNPQGEKALGLYLQCLRTIEGQSSSNISPTPARLASIYPRRRREE